MKNKNVIIVLGLIVVIVLGYFTFQNLQNKKVSLRESNNKVVEKQANKNIKQDEKKVQENNNGVRSDDDYGDPNASVVYYYGRECPHCEEVAEFLGDNDIYSKVDFAKKEVWHNKDNGKELMEAAQKCGIDPNDIGVPFLFADGKCFIGGPDVTNYFKEKAGIK